MNAFEETRELMTQGDTVAVRTKDCFGMLLEIDADGVAKIQPSNGEAELPVPLGDPEDFELIQGRMGEYILRLLGTGREKAGYETITLRHEFSKDEMDAMAEEMDQTMARKQETERELESLQQAVKERKSTIEGYVSEVSLLASKRRERFEMQPTKCDLVKDYDKGVLEYRNPETGLVVKIRSLSNMELQTNMPFDRGRQEEAA
jgi:hypothetical protein